MIIYKKPVITAVKTHEFKNNEEKIREMNSKMQETAKEDKRRQQEKLKYVAHIRF